MQTELLSKTDISAGKGLSILLIVMHNVTHLYPGYGENEFNFNSQNLEIFLNTFPKDPVTCLFSFFGWIGVSFFVFATGYGLSVKYKNQTLSIFNWTKRHYLKLFFLLLPAFAAYLLLNYIRWGNLPSTANILEQFLVLNILKPAYIVPGIYWYFGMAFQLYIFYLILRKCSVNALTFFLLLSMIFIVLVPERYMSYVRHNSLGWMPELLFGMICANLHVSFFNGPVKNGVLFASLCIIFFSIFSKFTYSFSGLGFCLFIICIRNWISRVSFLTFLGYISAAIYVVHAVVRSLWFDTFLSNYDIPSLAVAMIVLVLSILLSIPYTWYYLKTVKFLNIKNAPDGSR